jgi:UDP-N-acetylglucosamine 2-epimerase (non-hydrolysing)
MKTIVTITGIRPDFIRMSFVFKELDKVFNHILIHTGQHFNPNMSEVFFQQLNIRQPDYILDTGKSSSNHYEQLAYLTIEIPKLFDKHNINPDLILFLGDSNSAGVAFPLKKQGYRIAHIEAGMRSYDKRMLEEINRTICDHCSDILFVYHDDYKKQLELENIKKNVFVVGNTIVEPVNLFSKQLFLIPKKNDMILMDIHRPENFNYEDRLKNIILFGNECYKKYNIPVKLLFFPRLKLSLEKYNINLANIEMIDLVPFKEYLEIVYHSKFLISDSGTGQEEPSLLNTPVIVPRDFTERVQSYDNNCSFQLKVNTGELNFTTVYEWLEQIFTNGLTINSQWLGDGNTSKLIVEKLVDYFK